MINVGEPPMYDDSLLEKAQFVKEELINEMDKGLDYVKVCVGKMYGGIKGWFFNPIAKLVYNIMARKDIREKAIGQVDIVLECAMKYDPNGSNLADLVEENFEDYLLNDQSFHRCKKNHKTYPVIERIMKDLFKSRIKPAHKLISSTGACYAELTTNAFPEKQDALDNLQRELNFSYELLGVIKENKNVMKIPSFIRDGIIKIMELGQRYAKERMTQRIYEIFQYNGHE